MSELTVSQQASLPIRYSERAHHYARQGKAANTKRAYRSGWRDFSKWCDASGREPLPADVATVIDYLTHLADRGQAMATIDVKRAAIASAHATAGYGDPTKHPDVATLVKGIARTIGRAQAKKEPVTLDDLRAMVGTLDTSTVGGKRDKALILLGYAGAFRRSELVALDVADLRVNGKVVVTLRKSKTDQEAQGRQKHVPTLDDATICPVTALLDYLDTAGIESGPVFRRLDRAGRLTADRLSAQSVALILKATAKAAGLDHRNLSGHSLRAGYITTANRAGASDSDIMAQTHHTSPATLAGYKRDAGVGAECATLAAFGQT
jgi:site-specific recombinase XerD